MSIRLVSIEIPNAWYLFSHIQKNNIFQVEITLGKIIQIYNIVIPDGNYDIDTLTHFLNSTYFYESGLETYLKYIKFSIDTYNLKSRFEILENTVKVCIKHFDHSVEIVSVSPFFWKKINFR